LISFFIFILLASSAVRVRRSVIAALFNSSFEEMLFSFQDKSRSVLVSDDASATTLLLILIRDDDDDEFKFVRGLNIFSQRFFAATTTTREQQKRGVVLIIDFSDEEATEEEEIMLLFMMMMPCALYRYIHRERKRVQSFSFLSSVPNVVLVL
jgi:hypothetical protein